MGAMTSPTNAPGTQSAKNSRKKLIVLCGPSGAVKSSLLKTLMSDFPKSFGFAVSHTTRDPRPGERDGVDYHYVKKEVMDKMIADGAMIEYAHVHKNTYGTSFQAVEAVTGRAQRRRCILDIDVQGVDSVKKMPSVNAQALYIFVAPPSIEVLEKRLRSRGTE